MQFSTRTRYGLRFLVRLAKEPAGKLVQLPQIANEEQISCGYLEQIVRALKPLGILRAVRGVGGGYALSKKAQEILLDEVIARLEGSLKPVACLEEGRDCVRESVCSTKVFWQVLAEHLRNF
ncbi:MAG: Rrf2 family transcriptional regulator, partial [Desulfovibrio sp.]|nr:Rrf2 family transcriptional regulator [Desulfovibrio sp.]